MFYFLIKTTIISLILIFLVHYLYDFFKTNLTVPKIKDLVNRPNDKYNDIMDTIQNNNSQKQHQSSEIPKVNESQNMKDELKSYLKQQMVSKEPISFSSVSNTGNMNGNTFGSSDLGNYSAY